MLPYESRLNQTPHPMARPPRSLNAFAANRALDHRPSTVADSARRLADPYSAAVGSGGFSTALPTASTPAPRGLTPVQQAQIGATKAAITHQIGGAARRAATLAVGAVSRASDPPAHIPTPPTDSPLAQVDSADTPFIGSPMQAAQTAEHSAPRSITIGHPHTPQADIAHALQSARALQDLLNDRSVRQFRSKRQAIANEFSRSLSAQDSQHAQATQAQSNRDLAQAQQAHDVQQANANRRQQAAQFNAQQLSQSQLARRSLDKQTDQPWQMSQTADGTPGIIRSSGRFTPITGADGQPVELARPQQGIAPETLFKAFTEAENSIRSNLAATPEEQQAQLAQLYRNPLYQPLLRQNAPSHDAQLTPDGRWVRQLPDGRWQAYGE